MKPIHEILSVGIIILLMIVNPVNAQTDDQNDTTQAPNPPSELDTATEESMISFSKGLTALKLGQVDEAIEHLKEAIRNKPQEALYRYTLANAYKEAELWLNRWFQLRQAVLLKPDFAEAIQELLEMWQVALNKNVLDIGTPSETVKAALGEPDQIQTEGEVTSWQYGFMSVQFQNDQLTTVVDLRALGTLEPPLEVIEFGFDQRQWQLKQRRIELGRSILEYALVEADADQEVYTVERLFDLKKDMSAIELMENMRSNLQQKYPDVIWRVLKEEPGDVFFEWLHQVDGESVQHEITRLLAGKKDIHRLAYTTHKIEERELWLSILHNAKLTTE